MEKRMNRKSDLSMIQAFRIMKPGKFYWRLWTILFAGGFFSSTAFQLSVWVDFIKFEALFYVILLGFVSFIGGDLRDGMVAKGSLERYLLWPVNRRRKMLWLYLRSIWLPGILYLMGGLIFGGIAEKEGFVELLYSLPYGLAALFMLTFITWRGNFVSMEVEGIVDVSFRMEAGVGRMNLLLMISPLGLIFVSPYVLYPVALAMVLYGVRLFHSEESLMQLGGVSQNPEERYSKWMMGSFGKGEDQKVETLDKMKSPISRYYRFLDWEEHRHPLTYYLINLGTVLFIVTIYYALMGFFLTTQVLEDRAIVLGMLIGYGTFFLHHVGLGGMGNERALLLPLNIKDKATGETLHRFFRPSAYLLVNSVIVSGVLGFGHILLHQFFSGQQVPWISLVTETLYYALGLLPLWIVAFSLGEVMLKAFTLLLQQIGFYEIRGFIFGGYFFIYLMPMVFSLFIYENFISNISTFVGVPALLMYLILFLISRWGIYQMSKKIQVISS